MIIVKRSDVVSRLGSYSMMLKPGHLHVLQRSQALHRGRHVSNFLQAPAESVELPEDVVLTKERKRSSFCDCEDLMLLVSTLT